MNKKNEVIVEPPQPEIPPYINLILKRLDKLEENQAKILKCIDLIFNRLDKLEENQAKILARIDNLVLKNNLKE